MNIFLSILQGIGKALFGEPKAKTLRELRDRDYSPEQLKDYSLTHWRYRADESLKEDWLPPDVAFSRLQAEGEDCDGYAVVFWYCLSRRYLAKLLYIADGKQAHAVCIYQKDGKWFYIDNIRRYLFGFKSIGDICTDVFSGALYSRFYDWKETRFIAGEIAWRK